MKVKNRSKKKKLGGASLVEKYFIRIHKIGYMKKVINKETKFYNTSVSQEYSPKRYEKAVYNNQFYTESFHEAENIIKNKIFKEKPLKYNLDFTASPVLNILKSKSEGFLGIEKAEIYNEYGSTEYINDEIKEEIKAAKEEIKKFKENNKKSHKGGVLKKMGKRIATKKSSPKKRSSKKNIIWWYG